MTLKIEKKFIVIKQLNIKQIILFKKKFCINICNKDFKKYLFIFMIFMI